jgi:hypothetical protein
MRLQQITLGIFGTIALICLVLAATIVWLFLTDPLAVANVVGDGQVTPFVRSLASVILAALQGLLKYL